MARRRPWPVNADDHRVASAQHAQAIATIADDLDGLTEFDYTTIKMAVAYLKMHAAEIKMHLALAKFGQPEEF